MGPLDQYFDEAMLAYAAFATTPPPEEREVTRYFRVSDEGELTEYAGDADLLDSDFEYAMAADHRQSLNIKPEHPKNFRQAVKGKYKREWIRSGAKERSVLVDKKVFRVVEDEELDELLASDTHILTGVTAVKEKINEDGDVYKMKSRAVKHGFKEREYLDFFKTYAAVASGTAIRVVIAIGVGAQARFKHLDIVGAFLNSENPAKQFMWAPEGVRLMEKECWELLKSLYGCCGAGSDWKGTFTPVLVKFGFKAVTVDETVFILRNPDNPDEFLIIALYVDDTILAETWESKAKEFVEFLNSHFETNDEGELSWFLSVNYV